MIKTYFMSSKNNNKIKIIVWQKNVFADGTTQLRSVLHNEAHQSFYEIPMSSGQVGVGCGHGSLGEIYLLD